MRERGSSSCPLSYRLPALHKPVVVEEGEGFAEKFLFLLEDATVAIWIANMSGSGRLQLVMLNPNHAKICVA